MNRKIIILLSLAAVSLLGGGCKKFLAEKSQDEMTPETTESLNELLANEGYPIVNSSGTATDGFSFCNYLQLMDDDVHLQNYNAGEVGSAKPIYIWSDNMYAESALVAFGGGLKNPYQSLYNRIRGCNVVMDMLSSVSGPQADKDQMQGEALTLRAYYYFMLANLYGWPYNDSVHSRTTSLAVPIITKGAISSAPVARNTVQEVYDLMVSDIEKAVGLLEEQKSLSTVFRINYRSAWLLASRIFLHREQWDSVVKYTNAVINDYPIISDLNTMKVPVAQGLFSLNNANFIDPSNPEMLFLFSAARAGDGYYFNINATYPSLITSPDLTSIYEPNDMRFAYYTATNPPPNFFLVRQSGYYMPSKYYVNGVAGRCFRMSEAYVNRAEANIRKVIAGGDPSLLQAALDDLNNLRTKRFKVGAANATVTLASLNSDPQQVLQFYKAERRRELCFEEFRWFDLRRYGQPSIVHIYNPNEPFVTNAALPVETYTLPAHGNRYVLKIPQANLDANSSLVQNP